ncbi:MAG: septum formation protein [Candidatus Peregrinibacteria bacterium Greene0416_62]|nr:MAG: septum formation protein [Candidatus Peregrinibacteria bacterium Greene0416_62]TSD00116.1 MAG: septum formation protein [Candidatus Peregrinibacteria bacterium Greene1014_49]
MRFILASASPQRKSLLQGLGMAFDVVPSSLDESTCAEKDPSKRAAVLARLKAEDIFQQYNDCVVLGCDTLVVAADGTLLEKPRDAAEAERMLRLQSGKVSTVHSALCLIDPSSQVEGISSSRVHFKKLSDQEIAWWISTGQWKDRSGGFQIDGLGQLMIENLGGDWTSVVGLPVYLLGELMGKVGVRIDVVPL